MNDDDAPNYEADDYDYTVTPKHVTVIYHSRKKFYNGRPIYWYEFMGGPNAADFTDLIPQSFINVPLTVLYEYGGTHAEALKELAGAGFVDIVEGDEL